MEKFTQEELLQRLRLQRRSPHPQRRRHAPRVPRRTHRTRRLGHAPQGTSRPSDREEALRL